MVTEGRIGSVSRLVFAHSGCEVRVCSCEDYPGEGTCCAGETGGGDEEAAWEVVFREVWEEEEGCEASAVVFAVVVHFSYFLDGVDEFLI